MAAVLGKPVSTVHSWKVRGSIPDQSKGEILGKAKEAGLPLGPSDFFPDPPATSQMQDGSAA